MEIRSFLAFPASSDLKETLKRMLHDLQDTQADVKWVKIVWLGLEDPHQKIQKIVEALETEFVKLGIAKDDHSFKPHITLGRVKSLAHIKDLIRKMSNISFDSNIKQIFNKMILYKSTLTSDGPIYEVLEEFALDAGKLKQACFCKALHYLTIR